MAYIKAIFFTLFLGLITACAVHLIKQFDKDSQALKNAHQPTMIMGDS